MQAMLARLCAPALAGIKPSNLAAIDKVKYPHLREELSYLNAVFAKRGVCFDVLCECNNKALVLVYRPRVLEAAVRREEIAAVLRLFGYDPALSLDALLHRLRERMKESDEFPHEIGAFLGYPAADILGFLTSSRRGVLLVGEWKVYADADNARRLFSRYAACRRGVCRRLQNGCSLAGIFKAA